MRKPIVLTVVALLIITAFFSACSSDTKNALTDITDISEMETADRSEQPDSNTATESQAKEEIYNTEETDNTEKSVESTETESGSANDTSAQTDTEELTESASLEDTDTQSETKNETESLLETESASEKESEKETEVESMPSIDISEYDVTPALPQKNADISYTCADSSQLSQYNSATLDEYLAACSYYLTNGYTPYSRNKVGETKSLVVTKGSSVCTLLYVGNSDELYITLSESADTLPKVGESYEKAYEVSVTQHYSDKINGMGYVVRLEDGSLIVYDGGYDTDAEDLYKIICSMSPFEKPRIRAWVLTHSHGDHYTAFSVLAPKYADNIDLDTVIYAPAKGLTESTVRNGMEYFDNTLPIQVSLFEDAKLCPVHTGMSFDMAGVKLEILMTSEFISKDQIISDSNDTSTVTRIVSSDGSMIFLGDIGATGCNWMVNAYNDALKSDMVQVSHHGCETATAEFYDKVAAPLLFWPCNENLFSQYRGELVKQHLIESESSLEHILHGYGTVTRKLSYKPRTPEYIDLFPKSESMIKPCTRVENARIEDGAIKYEVIDPSDPYVSVILKNVDTKNCNMLRIVANSDSCKGSQVFVTFGDMTPGSYSAIYKKDAGVQGSSDDGKTTLLVYLGNLTDFNGDLNAVRFDFGNGVEAGSTVEIYSIEAFFVDITYIE